MAVRNRRYVDASAVGHGLQRIHKQIYQHTMNAMPIQHYGQPYGHNAHDAHSLQFSSHCNPVHRPGDQFMNVGKLPFSLRTSGLISALIEELLQQLAHTDGGAIYIPGDAAGLRLREHRADEHLGATVDCRQRIAQIMGD
jgi:hypothetical protein